MYNAEKCAKEFEISLNRFYEMGCSFVTDFIIKDNKALYCDGGAGYAVIELRSEMFEDGLSIHKVDECAYFEVPLSVLMAIVDELIYLKEIGERDYE